MLKKISFLLGKKSLNFGFFIILGSLILIIFEIIGLSSIPIFIGIFTNPEKIIEKLPYIKNVYNLEIKNYVNQEFIISGIIFLIFLIKNLYSLLFLYFQDLYYADLKKKFSSNLLKKYLSSEYNFFKQNNSSLLTRNIINESRVAVSYVNYFFRLVKDLLLGLSILVTLLFVNPMIISILFLVFTSFILIYFFLIKKLLFKLSKNLTNLRGLQLKYLNQIFNSIKLINLRNNHKFFFDKYNLLNSEEKKFSLISNFLVKIPKHFFEVISVASLMIIFLSLNIYGETSINDNLPLLAFFTLCFLRLVPVFNSISESVGYLRSTFFQFEYIINEQKNNYKNSTNSIFNKKDISSIDSNLSLFKKLEIKNLEFYYDKYKKIFQNINLEIKKNTNVCLMGESGSGKSTLVDIIMGLQYPISGQVLINGSYIQNVLYQWKERIGYIPQDIYLEDSTIVENIAFGVEKDKIDLRQIKKVIHLSQLKNFIKGIKGGIHANVGERGSRLSGGQIQRIGIARALYTNPEFLIMDEATNALDEKTEKKIYNLINTLKSKYTILTITHKETVAKFCDSVYLIKDKKLFKK